MLSCKFFQKISAFAFVETINNMRNFKCFFQKNAVSMHLFYAKWGILDYCVNWLPKIFHVVQQNMGNAILHVFSSFLQICMQNGRNISIPFHKKDLFGF